MSTAHPTVRGRFAPSPTGAMHLGNAWTALLSWLDARQHGGSFVLRMEDLDPERSRPQLAANVLVDLRWLGLDWDEGPDVGGSHGPYAQDLRRAHYAAALARLLEDGVVYHCFCSRAEMRAAALAPHGPDMPAHCPNHCWALSEADRRARFATGRPASIRIRIPSDSGPVHFLDRCAGPQSEDVASAAGDFVLRRADGVHAYQLAVVVDDGLMHISDVVRGNDLLTSTARQMWLHRRLGFIPPRFAHVPLLVAPNGERLSKRHAALALAQLRAARVSPREVVGYLGYWANLIPEPVPLWPHELVGTLQMPSLPQHNVVIDPESLPRLA